MLSIGVMCTTISKKYEEQIENCNQTWIKDAEENNIKIYLLAGYQKSDKYKLTNLPNVGEDYHSAFYKQFHGLQYMLDNSNTEFYMIIGTDTYLNIKNLLKLLSNYKGKDEYLYIGGHGWNKKVYNKELYFHSGGAGFILNRKLLTKLIDENGFNFKKIFDEWPNIAENYKDACDVAIAYYINQLNIKPKIEKNFFACNYKGKWDNHTCCKNINLKEIISCHYMNRDNMLTYYSIYNKSWTIVTGLFNVKRLEGSSGLRDMSFYIKDNFAMGLDLNMIIFCEKDLYLDIWKLRKNKNLLSRTYFIVMDFTDFPLSKYTERIRKNREGDSHYINHRNTPTYFTLVASKFWMMQKSMSINPFNSAYYAWIDFGLGYNFNPSNIFLSKNLTHFRDKFSLCYIDYTSEGIMRNNKEYYKKDRYGTACGFFTGNIYYMSKVCEDFNFKVVKLIESGYGHAEEQIIPLIYLDHPEWFKFYFGDYPHIITNYTKIYEYAHCTLYFFIPRTREDSKHELCYKACKSLWKAEDKKHIKLNNEQLIRLLDETFIASWWSNHKFECNKIINRYIEMFDRLKDSIKANQGRILEVTDYIKYISPKSKNIFITESYLQANEVNINNYINDGYKVFIYNNKDEITKDIFITQNPVIRNEKFKVDIEYTFIYNCTVNDVTIFNGEFDMLRLRLAELNSIVDRFIIVESAYTFTNIFKGLKLKEHPILREYKNKIVYLIIEKFPEVQNSWGREEYQRNFAIKYIKENLQNNDILILADLDEIPKADIIKEFKNKKEIHSLDMDFYYYNFNWLKPTIWHLAFICRKSHLNALSIQECRNESLKGTYPRISNAGWHLSYFMTINEIKNKVRSFSHEELNTEEYLNDENIINAISTGKDLFKRGENEDCIKRINQELPVNYKILPKMFHPY